MALARDLPLATGGPRLHQILTPHGEPTGGPAVREWMSILTATRDALLAGVVAGWAMFVVLGSADLAISALTRAPVPADDVVHATLLAASVVAAVTFPLGLIGIRVARPVLAAYKALGDTLGGGGLLLAGPAVATVMLLQYTRLSILLLSVVVLSGGWLLLSLPRWIAEQAGALLGSRRLAAMLPKVPDGCELVLDGRVYLEVPGVPRSVTIEGGRDTGTGDPAFDARFSATAEPDLLVSALDAATRALTLATLRPGDEVRDGTVRLVVHDASELGWRSLAGATLATKLQPAGIDGMARIARLDPVPSVRARALVALRRRAPDLARTIAEELADHEDAELRAVVAGVRSDAVALVALVTHPMTAVRHAALRSASWLQAVSVMDGHLAEDAELVVELLAEVTADVEPVLLRMLSGTGAIAAANLLGERGTVVSVPALLGRGGPFRAAALRIQSRLVGVEVGRVSLGAGGGELAIVEGGAVSVA